MPALYGSRMPAATLFHCAILLLFLAVSTGRAGPVELLPRSSRFQPRRSAAFC